LNTDKKDEGQKPIREEANSNIVFERQDHIPKTRGHALTQKFGKSVDLTKLTENTKNMHKSVDVDESYGIFH
jgi:hypothetical protein